MLRRNRPRTVAAVVLLAGALSAPAVFGSAAAGAAPVTATDPTGDTVTDTIEDPIAVPAADIVAMSADPLPDGITLAFRVAKPVDPAVDRNWLSVFTSAVWHLDTNGDSKRDYIINYYRDEDTNLVTADIDKSGPGHLPDECMPKPAYSAEAGYSVRVDPKCLGGASEFKYRLFVEYTTDAEDAGADIGTDVSPDGEGWAGPVTITLAAGETPVTTMAPITTPLPPPGSDKPTTTAPRADAQTPSSVQPSTPTSGKAINPQQVRPPRSRPTGGTTAQSATPSIAAPDLARTGLGDRALRMAAFAVGIGLMGIGLLFANRRPAFRRN